MKRIRRITCDLDGLGVIDAVGESVSLWVGFEVQKPTAGPVSLFLYKSCLGYGASS